MAVLQIHLKWGRKIRKGASDKFRNKQDEAILTYLDGSSRFWSFISVGMRRVASGPEAKGFGSCPLNSDWMN